MSAMNAVGIFAGAGQDRSVPQQLGAILYIPDLTTPVNGYWQDKSGKGKLVQAATTTVANDSLIMPANDADIIAALTLAGAYSKYYTNNSTPKTVLISQIASIDSKYCVFFDAKTKSKFSLFKTQGDESRADKMYEYTFKAYTGGYFPITQTSDSISFACTGSGTLIFNWDDGSSNTYTLSATSQTISHTYTTNIGLQKNISITGDILNFKSIRTIFNSSTIFRLSNIDLALLESEISGNLWQLHGLLKNNTYSNFKVNKNGNFNGEISVSGSNLIFYDNNDSRLTFNTFILNDLYVDALNCAVNCDVSKLNNNGRFIINAKFGSCFLSATVPDFNKNITILNKTNQQFIDLFLEKLSEKTTTVTSKSVIIGGASDNRSESTDNFVSELRARGWGIYTNNGYILEGDSITYGTGASPITESWVNKFMTLKGGDFINRGISGQTMSKYAAPLSYCSNKEKICNYYVGNKLVLAFGMNDCSLVTVEKFITDYTEVLNYLINTKGYPINKIYILNIYYSTAKAISCRNYNTALALLASSYNIQLIDIYTHMLNNGGNSLISADNVHPNNAGHTVIANYVASQII